MNNHTAELLERHFYTAFAAPDGIKKLRELILTLAMQGKLVPQESNEQPASELLQEIEAEKQRLVKEGQLKQSKPLPPVTDQEKPHALPKEWKWVRFGEIAQHNSGKTLDSARNTGFPRTYITTSNVYWGRFQLNNAREMLIREDELEKCSARRGDLLICEGGEAGRAAVWELPEEICFQNHVHRARLRNGIDPYFAYRFFEKISASGEINSYRKGVGISNMSSKALASIVFPLPPAPEQHRIVAKIDELMARCDELSELRTAQERARLIVHAAAIKRLLNIAEPDQHKRAQAFLAEHFGELYAVKENVAELRKAILQLAVMGKLTLQNPKDQPASVLAEEIEAQKKYLVQEGEIKSFRRLPPIAEDEKPYPLPSGWEWKRLGELAKFINGDRGKNYPNREEYVAEGIPWINTGHIEPDGSLTCRDMNFITKEKFDSLNGGKIESGDLVYCLRGATLGKTAIVDPYINGAIASSLMIIRPYLKDFNSYMYNYLVSPLGRSQILRYDNGSAQPNLSANNVQLYVYPLPPLSEQKRIVASVVALTKLCSLLDKNIEAAAIKRTELLNSLVGARSLENSAKQAQRALSSKSRVIDLKTYRTATACYAFSRLATAPFFGRTAAAKVMYLAQAHIGLELDLKPEREAAGPLDTWIYDFEQQGKESQWFEVNEKPLVSGKTKTEYRCLSALSEHAAKAETLMSPDQKAEFDRLIYALADKNTEEVEIIATLFAVWNDFIIDGVQPTDERIISDLRENWHERKARFTPQELGRWLDWLRRENFIPQGLLPRTVQQSKLRLT